MGNYGFSPLPGDLYKRWPKTPDGEPEEPVLLTHLRSNDMADILLANMLESYGIPVMITHPGDGDFGKVVLGMSGTGSVILVPKSLYEDAKTLMEAEPDDELQD